MAYIHCPRLGLQPPGSRPDSLAAAWAYFTSLPDWERLLQQDFLGKKGELIPFIGRGNEPANPRQNQLIWNLLHQSDGIRHILSFFITDDDKHTNDSKRPIKEIETLYSLGPAISGYADFVHGGLIMTLFDEGLMKIIELNSCLGKEFLTGSNKNFVTAGMNVRFIKPVQVDSEVSVVARLDKITSRQVKVVGEMLGSRGEVLATAETLFIAPRARAVL